MTPPPESWSTGIGLWLWCAGNWLFSGLNGLQVLLMVATLAYTVVKIVGDVHRLLVQRAERAARRRGYTGPLRRASDFTSPARLGDA